MDPLLINFTPTGMVPTKQLTPHVPVTPGEIVEQVHQACELGITIAHLHARDEQGMPTNSADIYGSMIEGIRRYAPDLIICVSLSGRCVTDVQRRAEPLSLTGALKPDMASLTLSSLNFRLQACNNSPETVQTLCGMMRERAVVPELEAFDTGMINYAKYLINKKMLGPPLYFNLIFGNIASAQADLLHAGLALSELPPRCLWAFGGIGDAQLPMNVLGIAMGGGVRVGLEDNIYFDAQRKRLATNQTLLQRIHDLAAIYGRRVMTPRELRETWSAAA
jgi:3-keto-5-aminohexanoate cleavage enzyme